MTSGGCSGSCGRAIETNTPSVDNSKFGVFCLTVSDRAAKGLYEQGDLSGKAMVDCVTQMAGDSMYVAGTKIVEDDPVKIQAAIREALA